MRNGSSGHDGRGWQPAHPYQGHSGPLPEMSSGYRRTEFDSGEYRQLVDDYRRDERQWRGGYTQPAAEDFGYGDPGYADPRYDGPRERFTGPQPAIGYQQPVPPAPDHVYPVTGAQEVYREPDEPRRAQDPRLAGLRYDELRYDDHEFDEPLDDEAWFAELRRGGPAFGGPASGGSAPGGVSPGGPAWGGAPSGGPAWGTPAAGGPGSGGPALGGPAAGGFAPGGGNRGVGASYGGGTSHDRGAGHGGAGHGGAGHGGAGHGGAASYGGGGYDLSGGHRAAGPGYPAASPSARAPQGTGSYRTYEGFPPAIPAPQVSMSAPQPMFPAPQQVISAPQQVISAPQASGYPVGVAPGGLLAAPVASRQGQVDVLTPPGGNRFDAESLEAYWEQDDDEVAYSALLEDLDIGIDEPVPDTAPERTRRGTGRRRGRSNDHRLYLGLGGVVVVAVAAIFAIVKFEFPSSGPAHTLAMPKTIGCYTQNAALGKSAQLQQLHDEIIRLSNGQATDVMSAAYECGATTPGSNTQIVMPIAAHFPNDSAAESVATFTRSYPGAHVVAAGALGGQAACAEGGSGADSFAICAWFDNDSFGVNVSSTMNATQLADVMRTFRSAIEQVAK